MSHRVRRTETYGAVPRDSNTALPQINRIPRSTTDKMTSASPRLSVASVNSSGKRSSSSFDASSRTALPRPSGIPRATPTTVQPKISAVHASKPVQSQLSKSSKEPASRSVPVSTVRSHIPAPITMSRLSVQSRSAAQDSARSRTSALMSDDRHDHDALELPTDVSRSMPAGLPPGLIPELQALAANTSRPNIATSTISSISSPSTHYTTSPSLWSASTTATTPVSWSSASPCILRSTRSPPQTRRSQTVPIPALPKARLPQMPVLSDGSLIKDAQDRNIKQEGNQASEVVTPPRKLKKKRTPLNSPAPTPPPRSSSVKRTRSRSSSKSDAQAPEMTEIFHPPLPTTYDLSPLTKYSTQNRGTIAADDRHIGLKSRHDELQDAIGSRQVKSQPYSSMAGHTPSLAQSRAADISGQNVSAKLLDAARVERKDLPARTSEDQSTDAREKAAILATSASRSRLAKFSKIGIFSRSTKSLSADDAGRLPHHPPLKKGPVAGTGHEGYGRYARRGRRVSIETQTTGTESEGSVVSTTRRPARSLSRRSNDGTSHRNRLSQSDLDDFAATRMKPVVMLGGSQRTASQSSIVSEDMAHHELDDRSGSGLEFIQQSSVQSRPGDASTMTRDNRSDSVNEHVYYKPTLAQRRSQKFDRPEDFRVPDPIRTNQTSTNPYPTTWNTSQSSIGANSLATTDASGDMYRIEPQRLEKQRKKSRKLKWNFFRKRDEAESQYQQAGRRQIVAPEMAVSVSAFPTIRSVPYYAMLESGSETTTTEMIGEFLTEATQTMCMDEYESMPFSPEDPESYTRERVESLLLPSAPQYRRDIEPSRQAILDPYRSHVLYDTDPLLQDLKQRQPRLAQVGRIPKVISTNQRVLSSRKSFSRPFRQGPPVFNEAFDFGLTTEGPAHVSPALEIHTDLLPSREFASPDSGKPLSAPVQTSMAFPEFAGRYSGPSYGRFEERQSTTSSSSDGVLSVIGPPLFPPPNMPLPETRHKTAEDDIWNEYDEFIDRVMSPPRLRKSTTRIPESSVQEVKIVEPREQSMQPPRSTISTLAKGLAIKTSFTSPPMVFSSPHLLPEAHGDNEVRLRRSRIVSALHSSLDPSSPFTIDDYLGEQTDFFRNSDHGSAQFSNIAQSPAGLLSPRAFALSDGPFTTSPVDQYKNAAHMDEVERSKDPLRHSELSYASLMVSRWLSFGRVLFSPAHAEITSQAERHVLVIDGLGNEDWSIYCAVTYQAEQAYIYNLRESKHTKAKPSQGRSEGLPPNYRRREVASFHDSFKFPDNYFSAIVLRFPPVMAESKLRNIVHECRRVLAPGGYMELMLLDLDIVNMGVVTRRAMRHLKTKITMTSRDINLKPMIDNVQSVLGEEGFSKLSRCVVGVPVVGKPPGTADSPVSSRSSRGSDKQQRMSLVGPQPFDSIAGQHHPAFSLHDLVADHSDTADAKIGKMVSRTARLWWQHCFETAVISDGNLSRSMLVDKQLLSECKSRASSFKLLIAYTQKPQRPTMEIKRRTMSEPVVATLATAAST